MIRIAIANEQQAVKLERRFLRQVVRTVLDGEGIDEAEISLAFVTDARIQQLNERFLEHDGPTDVITFPLNGPGERLVGEIVLSGETAARVARERGHSAQAEATLYVIHGLLHLCGYDDHAPRDRRRMREGEDRYLKVCGLRLR